MLNQTSCVALVQTSVAFLEAVSCVMRCRCVTSCCQQDYAWSYEIASTFFRAVHIFLLVVLERLASVMGITWSASCFSTSFSRCWWCARVSQDARKVCARRCDERYRLRCARLCAVRGGPRDDDVHGRWERGEWARLRRANGRAPRDWRRGDSMRGAARR